MQAGPTESTGGLRTRGASGLEVARGVVAGTAGAGRLSTPEQLSRRPVTTILFINPELLQVKLPFQLFVLSIKYAITLPHYQHN